MNSFIKKILVTVLLLFSFNAVFSLTGISDSIAEKLVTVGSKKLKKLQLENEEHIKNKEYDKLNFIINLGTNDNLINYEVVLTTGKFIDNLTKEQALNERLKQLYINSNYTKQCYLLLINYFDIEIKLAPPDSLTIEDVFKSNKFFDENSNIIDCKNEHRKISSSIENQSFDKSKHYYFLSLARFRAVFQKDENPKSAYTWFSHFNAPENLATPDYFNETYDYLKTYLISSKDKKYNSRETIVEDFVTAFQKAYKNAPLKAQILSTHKGEDLKNILLSFSIPDYCNLTEEENEHILKIFISEDVLYESNYFAILRGIINANSVNISNITAFADFLKSNQSPENLPIWKIIMDGLDDTQVFEISLDFVELIKKLPESYYTSTNTKRKNEIGYGAVATLLNPGVLTEFNEKNGFSVLSSGVLKLTQKFVLVQQPNPLQTYQVNKFIDYNIDPFSFIELKFLSNESKIEFKNDYPSFVSNSFAAFPSFCYDFILNKRNTEIYVSGISNSMYGLSFGLGVAGSQVTQANKYIKYFVTVKNYIDGVNLFIQQPTNLNAIKEIDTDGKFLGTWNKMVLISDGVYFSSFAKEIGKIFVTKYKNIKISLKTKLSTQQIQDIDNVANKIEQELVADGEQIVDDLISSSLSNVSSIINRIDDLGLTALKNEINSLDAVAKTKFLDDFSGASDDALRAIDGNTSLVNYWKINGNFIKNRVYPNVRHKVWDDTKNAIIVKADPTETKILNAIENAPPPGNKVVMAGAYSPDLPTSNVTIKYNDKNFNVSYLEDELKQHLEYLQMIKNDFDNGGKLYQKLYSNVPEFKIQNAEIAGTHAEVIATNEVIIQLKADNKFSGIQDLNKIHVLVKGRASLGNMCRCPHCFQILDGVKMIGNQ